MKNTVCVTYEGLYMCFLWLLLLTRPVSQSGSCLERQEPENYRFMCLTLLAGNILGTLVRCEIMKHLEKYQLTKGSYFRFIRNNLCLTNVEMEKMVKMRQWIGTLKRFEDELQH